MVPQEAQLFPAEKERLVKAGTTKVLFSPRMAEKKRWRRKGTLKPVWKNLKAEIGFMI